MRGDGIVSRSQTLYKSGYARLGEQWDLTLTPEFKGMMS